MNIHSNDMLSRAVSAVARRWGAWPMNGVHFAMHGPYVVFLFYIISSSLCYSKNNAGTNQYAILEKRVIPKRFFMKTIQKQNNLMEKLRAVDKNRKVAYSAHCRLEHDFTIANQI